MNKKLDKSSIIAEKFDKEVYAKTKELATKICEVFEKEKVSYQIFNAALNLCVTGIISQHKGANLWEASDFLEQNKCATMLHLAHEGWIYKDKKK